MNVIDVLTAHHGTLRQLYRQSEEDPAVFMEFVRHLIVHHTMEEKYFYDVLESYAQARHDALEAVNEHHIIEMIVNDSQRFPRDHERFAIKIEGLGEYTTHHLDEEEAVVFPLARQVIDAGDLNTLGRLFQEAKSALLEVVLPEVPPAIVARGGAGAGQASAEKPMGDAAVARTAAGLGIGSLRQ